jgi:hypothetical protein
LEQKKQPISPAMKFLIIALVLAVIVATGEF